MSIEPPPPVASNFVAHPFAMRISATAFTKEACATSPTVAKPPARDAKLHHDTQLDDRRDSLELMEAQVAGPAILEFRYEPSADLRIPWQGPPGASPRALEPREWNAPGQAGRPSTQSGEPHLRRDCRAFSRSMGEVLACRGWTYGCFVTSQGGDWPAAL
jgi:hypothetical protein